MQSKTVTAVYCYYYHSGQIALTDKWVQFLYEHQDINYPNHTLGLILDCWIETPAIISIPQWINQIQYGLNHHFTSYEYYAWARGYPTPEGIINFPALWQNITSLNQNIINTLGNLWEIK